MIKTMMGLMGACIIDRTIVYRRRKVISGTGEVSERLQGGFSIQIRIVSSQDFFIKIVIQYVK